MNLEERRLAEAIVDLVIKQEGNADIKSIIVDAGIKVPNSLYNEFYRYMGSLFLDVILKQRKIRLASPEAPLYDAQLNLAHRARVVIRDILNGSAESTSESDKTYTSTDINWLLTKYEQCSERYMEAETIIATVCTIPWWKLLFIRSKLLNFLISRKKYKF